MTSTSNDTRKLPEVSFLTLVELFGNQAYMGLGGIQNPETKKPFYDLALAKHAIDLLGVLEEKTKGNLTAPERNFLENTLYDLRMRYLYIQNRPPETDEETSSGKTGDSGENAEKTEATDG